VLTPVFPEACATGHRKSAINLDLAADNPFKILAGSIAEGSVVILKRSTQKQPARKCVRTVISYLVSLVSANLSGSRPDVMVTPKVLFSAIASQTMNNNAVATRLIVVKRLTLASALPR
jgi:hypothetical protein